MDKNKYAFKMIATDLDGTLLQSDETISETTLAVMRRCQESGIKIVIVTARSFRRVQPFLDVMPCDAVICHNGAAIYSGNAKIAEFSIPSPAAAEILRHLHVTYPHMPIIADCDERLYANFDVSALWHGVKSIQTDFTDLPEQAVEKIYAGIDCDATAEKIRSALPATMDMKKLGGNFILITHARADKANALAHLARALGIVMEEIVAFGDDSNDIAMLRAAGRGVAVANATDAVKATADEITGKNDEDGVAHFIKNFFEV